MSYFKISWLNDVCTITLNRKEKGNSYDLKCVNELLLFLRSSELERAFCLVIKAEGNNFCTGADLDWMHASAKLDSEENIDEMNLVAQMYWSFMQVKIPVISLIEGNVYGGGLGFVAVSDYVISSNDVTYCLPEVRLGLIPGVIAPLIIEKIGKYKFIEMAMTGDKFNASQVCGFGLINHCADRINCENDLNKFIADLKKSSRASLINVKMQSRKKMGVTLDDLVDAARESAFLRSKLPLKIR